MADEKKTFDEILEDADYKAEFDRRVTKAVSTVQKKLDDARDENKQLVDKYGTGKDGDDIATMRTKVDELTKLLGDRDYADAVSRAIENADEGKGLKFTSKSAREAFVAAVKSKGLKLTDGELEGFDEFVAARKKADPDAFKKAEDDTKPPEDPKPAKPPARFTGKMAPAGSGGQTKEEIEAITDKAERRAAIAANLNLFEGEA